MRPLQLLALLVPLTGCRAAPDAALVPTHVHHAIDYVELAVHDLAVAKAFYAAAFGWQFNDYGPDYAGIRRLDAPGESGGLRPAESVATGGPLVILYSRDLEASAAAVRAAGGRIVQEILAFPGGRRFQFADPSGNELAVWSDRAPSPLEAERVRIGDVWWYVDLDAALAAARAADRPLWVHFGEDPG